MHLREKILKDKQAKRFYDLCKEGIKDADGNFFCPFCGELKKEFNNPMTGNIRLLDCECEKQHKMLRDVYSDYRINKHKGVDYNDLIDGIRKPINAEENDIMIFGIQLRDELYRLENLLKGTH